MNGKEFLNSKWCSEAESESAQEQIRKDFGKWTARVNNSGLLHRAKQLFQFFVSGKISGTKKILVAGALLYIISPLDLIPDFIPVIGWLDDLGIASFVLSYIFSQMDKVELQQLEESEEKRKAMECTGDELMNSEITGTSSAQTFTTEEKIHLSSGEKSDDLRKCLDELSLIAEKLNAGSAMQGIQNISRKNASSSMLKIAVTGRYSTGKSTLVNSLLKKNILPTSPVPTTKAITYVMAGKEFGLYSEQSDGKITIHTDIASLKQDSPEIVSAQKITLVLPDFPIPGLTIMDTPGLEEPDVAISQLTLNSLPEMDAIIVMLDANYMQSEVEFKFIASLLSNDRNRKLFIVINKVDKISDAEISRLKQLCSSHLISHGIPCTRIFALSARDGESNPGFCEFKNELFRFLQHDIQKEALRHNKSEADAYCQILMDTCTQAISQVNLDEESRQNAKREARNEMSQIAQTYQNQRSSIEKKFHRYRSQFLLDLSVYIDQLKSETRASINRAKLDTLKNSDAIALEIKQKIREYVDRELAELDQKLQSDLSESRTVIRTELTNMNLPIHGVFKDVSPYVNMVVPTAIIAGYMFMGFFSWIFLLIPALIGRSFFENNINRFAESVGINKLRQKLSDEVDVKLESLKKELTDKLNTEFDKMESELLASFDNACSTAESSMSFVAEDPGVSMEEIRHCRAQLEAIHNNLN